MKILILLSILFLSIAGCKKTVDTNADLITLRAHKWQLTDYRKGDGTISMTEPDSLIRPVVILFLNEDSIIGNDVNDFTANYCANTDKHTLLIKVRSSTAVYSTLHFLNDFQATLEEAESYQVQGNELLINYLGGTRSLHFIEVN